VSAGSVRIAVIESRYSGSGLASGSVS
jgi:hypothetical protein